MQRRNFVFSMAATFTGVLLAACSTGPVVMDIHQRQRHIDTGFYATLERLFATVPGSRDLIDQARGVLIFPTVLTSGSKPASLYGEGVLRIADAMTGYYQMRSWQIVIPAGRPAKEIAILYLFMAQDALDNFRISDNWAAQRDAPVAILKADKDGRLEKHMPTDPVLALALGPDGNMSTITNETLRQLLISPLEF